MFTEDLSIFMDDFSQEVSFTLADTSTLTVDAIFDNAFYNTQLHDFDTTFVQPRLTCITSEIEDLAQNDSVMVGTITYYVFELQQDGTGMTTVILERVKNG